MTTEQKLQAIIEAQVKGDPTISGLPDNIESVADDGSIWAPMQGGAVFHILEILLDPAGLKAAYGDGMQNFFSYMKNCIFGDHSIPRYAPFVAHRILDTWLSSNGDANATINTAYSLLPHDN